MNTTDQILDSAEGLIQQRGYFGFSFQDVAEQIGIKKASIYYHFPAKAQLGKAVIDRYRARMGQVADETDLEGEIDYWRVLTLYLEPILEMGRSPEKACLCGVLGSEFVGLPEEMQTSVAAFFVEQQGWIGRLLDKGRAAGAFRFQGSPETMSKLVLSAVHGGMIIKRTINDPAYLDEVVSAVSTLLGRPNAG